MQLDARGESPAAVGELNAAKWRYSLHPLGIPLASPWHPLAAAAKCDCPCPERPGKAKADQAQWRQCFDRNARILMSILISILITFLVVILVLYLVNMLPIDGRAKQIVRVVVIIIGIVSLLRYLAVF
jgi:hypothetical protein